MVKGGCFVGGIVDLFILFERLEFKFEEYFGIYFVKYLCYFYLSLFFDK